MPVSAANGSPPCSARLVPTIAYQPANPSPKYSSGWFGDEVVGERVDVRAAVGVGPSAGTATTPSPWV